MHIRLARSTKITAGTTCCSQHCQPTRFAFCVAAWSRAYAYTCTQDVCLATHVVNATPPLSHRLSVESLPGIARVGPEMPNDSKVYSIWCFIYKKLCRGVADEPAGHGHRCRRQHLAPWESASTHTTSERTKCIMPSVAHFINNLGLDKADERTLLQHVQECHLQGGPSLDDRCTERVRWEPYHVCSSLQSGDAGTHGTVLFCWINYARFCTCPHDQLKLRQVSS